VVSGTFVERIDHFIDTMGHGRLVGSLEVNQVYAHYQNAHPEFRHPDGGGAYFMENGLFGEVRTYMAHLAELAVTPEGSSVADAMIDNMERYDLYVFNHAPWEFGDLRDSGHPVVTSDGDVIYDRAPRVGRLSEAELREKDRLRRIYDPDRYTERGAAVHAAHTHPGQHKSFEAREVRRLEK
jgi:hypothetical protein